MVRELDVARGMASAVSSEALNDGREPVSVVYALLWAGVEPYVTSSAAKKPFSMGDVIMNLHQNKWTVGSRRYGAWPASITGPTSADFKTTARS